MTDPVNPHSQPHHQPKESSTNPASNFSDAKKNMNLSPDQLETLRSSNLNESSPAVSGGNDEDLVEGPWASVLPPGTTKAEFRQFLQTLTSSIVYAIKKDTEKAHETQIKLKKVIEGEDPDES